LSEYGKKYDIQSNPLGHYLDFGVEDGLNPSLLFDTKYYLKSNPDIASAGINPFIHYTSQGCKENRSPLPIKDLSEELNYPVEEPIYISRLPLETPPLQKSARVIAFYLPQFHTIPENDTWWGNGFTEWTNVRPAKPQFNDHYQPHIPDNYLGYYDLRDREVMHKQIELAKQYGIEGFCFYTYWFSGHRLLETPVDNFLEDLSLDHPFCICWANENWSRRWDGLDQELLMVQNYSDDDDIAFIEHMSKYLRDPRYIHVDEKPLLIIYRPNLFPEIQKTAERWREWCRSHGIGEIHLAYVQSFEKADPKDYGFDAAIEFPPNNSVPPDITDNVPLLNEKFTGKIYDWRVFLKRSQIFDAPSYRLYPGVCPSWDNTARKKERGTVFANSSPKLFERWLTNTFKNTANHVEKFDQRLVFVNAWNEWAEGAHLEPDQHYGYAWLDAVRQAHINSSEKNKKILVISHDAHPHGAQYLILEVVRMLRSMHFDVAVLLLDGGKLQNDFENITQTVNAKIVGDVATQKFLSEFKNQGASIAITSTVVCGSIIPVLKQCGYRILSLIHELPGVIRQMQQESNAQLIAQHADKVVFPAALVHERFAEIISLDSNKVVIRPQGVLRSNPFKNRKDEAFQIVCNKHNLPPDTKIVLNIAYADMRKGADLFVEIAAETIKKRIDVAFIWVGHLEQAMQSQVERRIEELGLQNRILFVGFDKEPMAYYAAASVFALTSREDPFPNVVLESAEVNVPVIAFDGASGAGDFILSQGGRVAPYLDISAFSDQVFDILNNKDNKKYAPVGSLQRYVSDLLFQLDRHMRVSVIVPNYNYENYIESRLDDVCRQRHAIYELIVLDDNSTDNSVQVISGYLSNLTIDSQLVVNESNSGSVFKQWKRGLELSSGDLVWIAEADDLCTPEMLNELTQAFNDPSVVLAYCQSQQIDENGKLLAENYLDYTGDISKKWESDYLADGVDEIRSALCIKNTIPNVSAVVFRRASLLAAIDAIGGKLFNNRVAGDWLVYIHVLLQGKVFFCSKSLNKHRRHTVSVTKSTAVQSHFDEVVEMQKIATDISKPSSEVVAKSLDYQLKLKKHFKLV
jgi:glycosyltransferase involved in cell wall biosynthesis